MPSAGEDLSDGEPTLLGPRMSTSPGPLAAAADVLGGLAGPMGLSPRDTSVSLRKEKLDMYNYSLRFGIDFMTPCFGDCNIS